MTTPVPVILNDLLAKLNPAIPEQESTRPTTSSQLRLPALALYPPASNEAVMAELACALPYLSPDSPRGNGSIIGPDDQPVDGYWLGIIWAIRRALGAAGEDIAKVWSQGSSKFSEKGFDDAWNAYDPAHPDPVTIRSVYMLARGRGWPGSSQPELRPTARTSHYALLDRNAIMAIPTMRWRVKGLLSTVGIAAIFGQSGTGKSFLSFDLGVSIANGHEWFGRRTAACNVVYVMLEGEAGLRNRIEAGEKHKHAQIPEGFQAIIQPFSFASPQDVEDLAATLPKEGVVIIDTFNRSTPGLDENSGKDMGQALAGMKRIQEVTGGLVLIVHHTGKDQNRGLRGHSSLHAALDGAIEVSRTTNGLEWKAAKVKDGADGQATPFKLQVIQLAIDADGDEVSSCAVSPGMPGVVAPKEPSGSNQRHAFTAIRRAISALSQTGMGGCGPQTFCMKVEDAIDVVVPILTSTVKSKRRNYARKIVTDLIADAYFLSGLDADEAGWIWNC